MNKKRIHDECVCALNDTQLAINDERERLADLVSEWCALIEKETGRQLCPDSLFAESGWFPNQVECKNDPRYVPGQ